MVRFLKKSISDWVNRMNDMIRRKIEEPDSERNGKKKPIKQRRKKMGAEMEHLTVDEIIEFVSLTELNNEAINLFASVNGHIRK